MGLLVMKLRPARNTSDSTYQKKRNTSDSKRPYEISRAGG